MLRVHTQAQASALGDGDGTTTEGAFGLVWVDLGAGPRISDFIAGIWHSVDPNGGLLLLHSSLTNQVEKKGGGF